MPEGLQVLELEFRRPSLSGFVAAPASVFADALAPRYVEPLRRVLQ
jgi:hypothetical protein